MGTDETNVTTNYIWQIDARKQIFRFPGQGIVLARVLGVTPGHVLFWRETCSLTLKAVSLPPLGAVRLSK